MSAKITLIGFYNYDPTLFDGLTLPEGIEKDLVVDEILERSGEFESLYSNYDFVKNRIGMWGRKHYRTFDKWIKALGIEYDPLNNYDRFEEYTDQHTGNELTTGNRSDTAQNAQSSNANRATSDNRLFNELAKDGLSENTNSFEANNRIGSGSDITEGSANSFETSLRKNEADDVTTGTSNSVENAINSGSGTEHTEGAANEMNAKLDRSNALAQSHTSGNSKPVEQTVTKEHQVSAYDSATYQPSEKDTESNLVSSNATDNSSSDSFTGSEANAREIDNSLHSEDKTSGSDGSLNNVKSGINSSDEHSETDESINGIKNDIRNENITHSNDEAVNAVKNDIHASDADHSGANFTAGVGSESNDIKSSDIHAGQQLYNDNRLMKDETKHTAHLYGNIGVTSSQQLLSAELEVQRFNIYTQIADLFVQDFCIMLY